MTDTKPVIPGTPEFYRGRAKEMLDRAAEAATDEAKAEYIALAENWAKLAEKVENPGW